MTETKHVGARPGRSAAQLWRRHRLLRRLALVIALLGTIFAPGIPRLMATPIEARALACLRIGMLSMPFTCTAMIVGMGLHGGGDGTAGRVTAF